MALIKCPECKVEISDKAIACPKCGCPIAEKPQTIEQTGKEYKKHIVFSVSLIMLAFFVLMFGMVGIGTSMLFIGLIWLAVSIIVSWWHHG